MAIYTKTGDGGETLGPAGERVRKGSPYCCALGTLDELNSQLGLCLAACEAPQLVPIRTALDAAQRELFAAGALLAGAANPGDVDALTRAVTRMERRIDRAESGLAELRAFLLPRGCEAACQLHVARTVCRRAERAMVDAADGGGAVHPAVLAHLNRLGDLLFSLAREANALAGQGDEPAPTGGGSG